MTASSMPKKLPPKCTSGVCYHFVNEVSHLGKKTGFQPDYILKVTIGRYFPFLTKEDKRYLKLRLWTQLEDNKVWTYEEVITDLTEVLAGYDEFCPEEWTDLSTLSRISQQLT